MRCGFGGDGSDQLRPLFQATCARSGGICSTPSFPSTAGDKWLEMTALCFIQRLAELHKTYISCSSMCAISSLFLSFSSVCQRRTERGAEMEPFELGNALVKCRQSFLLLLPPPLLPPFSIASHFSPRFFFFLEGTIEDYVYLFIYLKKKRVLIWEKRKNKASVVKHQNWHCEVKEKKCHILKNNDSKTNTNSYLVLQNHKRMATKSPLRPPNSLF